MQPVLPACPANEMGLFLPTGGGVWGATQACLLCSPRVASVSPGTHLVENNSCLLFLGVVEIVVREAKLLSFESCCVQDLNQRQAASVRTKLSHEDRAASTSWGCLRLR